MPHPKVRTDMLETRRSCPACHSLDGRELLTIPYDDPDVLAFLRAYYCHASQTSMSKQLRDGTFALLECKACGLIYQREIPDSHFMQELYDEWIIESDALAPISKPMPIEHYTYLATEVMHLLAEQRSIVGPERRVRVLDFGMGWSAWLQVARSFGAVVYGAELSAPKIAYASSIGIQVLTLAQISDMTFDLICAEQVFEHVPHPSRLLESLVRSLAPRGYVKISVPPGDSIKAVLSKWKWAAAISQQDKLMPVHPLEHINCFSRRSLDCLAARYELERAPISPWRAMAYSTGWHTPKSAVKNILRPIYRYVLKRGTYAVYRRHA